MSESANLRLFLDLGDVFTKGIAVVDGRTLRLRFPSVVANRLLRDPKEAADLLLDTQQPLPRPSEFDSSKYPRSRSYPGADTFLEEVRADGHPLSGARFAGWLAVAHGADRSVLGLAPSPETIDALVHKALLLCGESGGDGEVVFVLDAGAKGEVVQRYAEALDGQVNIKGWSFLRSEPRNVEVNLRGRVVDAPDCAAAAVPSELSLEHVERLLLVDIGYLRTKLAIVSRDGCEHLEELEGLGLGDCVRRILRDEPERGLVEDEFAVIRALEQSQGAIEVAGRHFDVSGTLEASKRGHQEELARGVGRIVLDFYARRGDMCRTAAIFGGGAAIVGNGLTERLKAGDLNLETVWVAPDQSFLLADGAAKVFREK